MMKTNIQIKDEPVEFQVDKLFRLYAYQSSTKSPRTKSNINQEQEPSTCAWCQKLGIRSFTLRTDNGDSKSLCSEVCFNQYRRASFKKNKSSETDIDHNILPNISTTKNKPSSEKKKREPQLIDPNRRKILIPTRHSTPINTKPKINEIPQKFSPSSIKRQRSSTPPTISNGKIPHVDQTTITPSNLPVSLTWQPSLISWPSPIDINRFQYPFLTPPAPAPPPHPLPLPLSLPSPTLPNSSSSSSNLFSTLSKGTLSNYTCILPTFIPLPIPIPIPICLPIHSSCKKCSIEVNHQQTQTTISSEDIILSHKRKRRISI